MKTIRIFFAIAIFALAFLTLFSCKNKNAGKSTRIEYDSVTVKKQIPLLEKNDTTLPYSDVEIRFTYPKAFKNAEALARLQQIFVGTFFSDRKYDALSPKEATDKYLENYTAEYKELSNDYYADKQNIKGSEVPQWYWYQLNIKNTIQFQNDSLLSYAVEYSDYTGGAHGSFRVTYVNVDLNDLVTLSEEDLFIPNYKKQLTDALLSELTEKYNVTSPDSLVQQGFFTIEDIAPNNNFWMNKEGIHYAFNQYEVAPYAMGVIEVTIPYSKLKDILKPNGVISRYFGKE